MKYTLTISLLIVFFSNTRLTAQQEKVRSNIENFSSISGTLVEKEYIPIGFINKEVEMKIIKLSDLIGHKSISGVQIEYKNKYSTDSKTNFLDKDEIESLINSIAIIKDQINEEIPQNYKEIIFSSRSGLQAGCYWSKNKWTAFIKIEKRDSNSYAFISIEELDEFSNQLTKVKIKL